MKVATHHLRCTECASVITKDEVSSNFRCPQCNGLYEVVYPWSDFKPDSKPGDPTTPTPGAPVTREPASEPQRPPLALAGAPVVFDGGRSIRRLALPRPASHRRRPRKSRHPARRQHPALRSSPLRQSRRHRLAPRQAPGHEPHRLLQGHRHDRRALGRRPARLRVGRLRVHGKHLCRHGCLRRPRRPPQHRLHPRRQDRLGQALAGDGLRRPHHPAQDRLRRLRQNPRRTRAEASRSTS